MSSHPSLEERVAALLSGAKPTYPPLSECLGLLGGERATEDTWYDAAVSGQLARVDWDSFGRSVLQPQVERRFSRGWLSPEQMPLTALPELATKMNMLWQRLKPEGPSLLSKQAKRNHVQEVLEEWIIACLCRQGFVPRVSPGLALVMERGEQQVQPAMLLQTALRGRLKAASLKEYLVAP